MKLKNIWDCDLCENNGYAEVYYEDDSGDYELSEYSCPECFRGSSWYRLLNIRTNTIMFFVRDPMALIDMWRNMYRDYVGLNDPDEIPL